MVLTGGGQVGELEVPARERDGADRADAGAVVGRDKLGVCSGAEANGVARDVQGAGITGVAG